MHRTRLVVAAVVASICLAAAPAANAGPLWEFTTAGNSYTNGSWIFATPFSVNSAATVTGLGYYADPFNGFVDANEVALYQCADAACSTTGTLIASATVTNIYPLTGHFRYVTIDPLALEVGVSYEVVGSSHGNNYTWNDTGFAVDPAVSLIVTGSQVGRWQTGTALTFLNFGQGDIPGQDGFWGANVFIGPPTFTSVPEPGSSMLLLGLGLVGLSAWRKRRQ